VCCVLCGALAATAIASVWRVLCAICYMLVVAVAVAVFRFALGLITHPSVVPPNGQLTITVCTTCVRLYTVYSQIPHRHIPCDLILSLCLMPSLVFYGACAYAVRSAWQADWPVWSRKFSILFLWLALAPYPHMRHNRNRHTRKQSSLSLTQLTTYPRR